MFFSSSGAYTATKSLIANHRRPIDAQLYYTSVTQMFLMQIFVKVESDSSKLLRIVSKSGPNGCKERSRPQKMLMRTKLVSLLGRWNPVLTVTRSHKQPQEVRKTIVTWTAHKVKTKNNVKSSDIVIEGSGVVLPGEIKRMHWKWIIDTQRSLESWSRLGHFIIRSISPRKHVFCDGLWQHRRAKEDDGSSFYINEPITGFLGQLRCRGK